MKYRDGKIEEQMLLIEFLLTAISERKMSKLNVLKIMDEDKTMPIDRGIIQGMQIKANESMIAAKALAMGFDRVIAMVGQMVTEMDNANMTTASMYEKRLEVLTNFKRIMDELNPEMANRFAQM